MSSAIDLSIIIPAYMEAPGIAHSLQQLAAFLATRDYGEVEVLVVVAESVDGTAEIAARQAGYFRHFRTVEAGPRQGKGYQVRVGMLEARGRYRVFMDADLATPLEHLDEVHQLAHRGVHVGVAVRDLVKIHKGMLRKLTTSAGNVLAQAVLLPGIKDTQCGFKFLEAAAAVEVFGRVTIPGWGFDLEVLAIARRLGYSIVTVEVPDWHDPKPEGAGLVGDSLLKVSLQVLRDLFKVRWNTWTGRYNTLNSVHTQMHRDARGDAPSARPPDC